MPDTLTFVTFLVYTDFLAEQIGDKSGLREKVGVYPESLCDNQESLCVYLIEQSCKLEGLCIPRK